MGTDEFKMPEGYAEMVKAAQEQAIKAAQAQAQAMLGNIPGVQIPNMEEIQKQMQAGMPGPGTNTSHAGSNAKCFPGNHQQSRIP